MPDSQPDSQPDAASPGHTVQIHYTGKLQDGTVFDSSRERDPLEFTLGEQQVIPGFEQAVEGMKPGETNTTTVPPEQAYGSHNENGVLEVERTQLPDDMTPEVGQRLKITPAEGESFPVTVTEVAEENVTLDANHPLAGESLTFELELVEVK